MDRFHATIEISFKGQNAHDPVTEVDHAIEDLIRDEVHRQFPSHGVLGEERDNGGPLDADIVWVIDPLDGTSNFINGIGMFACSIGILHRGKPVAGCDVVAIQSLPDAGRLPRQSGARADVQW